MSVTSNIPAENIAQISIFTESTQQDEGHNLSHAGGGVGQEQSRAAGGRTFVKDLGSPLWAATYQSINLKPNDLDYWRARFKLLENGLNQFCGRPKSRCYPIAYPVGNFFGSDSFANLVIYPSFEDTTLSPWFPNAGISLGTGTGHTGTKFVVLDKGSAAAGTGTQRETLQVIDGFKQASNIGCPRG